MDCRKDKLAPLISSSAIRVLLLVIAPCLCSLFPRLTTAEQPSTILRLPGTPDRTIAPESLLGRDRRDVRVEDREGNVQVYHGLPLLEVLEKNGLQIRTMAEERKVAPAVLLVTARDGYAVVFSVGELITHRTNPRVYLVSKTAAGLLPPEEGPVRLIALGEPMRSAYGLASVELRYLAQNTSGRISRTRP